MLDGPLGLAGSRFDRSGCDDVVLVRELIAVEHDLWVNVLMLGLPVLGVCWFYPLPLCAFAPVILVRRRYIYGERE